MYIHFPRTYFHKRLLGHLRKLKSPLLTFFFLPSSFPIPARPPVLSRDALPGTSVLGGRRLQNSSSLLWGQKDRGDNICSGRASQGTGIYQLRPRISQPQSWPAWWLLRWRPHHRACGNGDLESSPCLKAESTRWWYVKGREGFIQGFVKTPLTALLKRDSS